MALTTRQERRQASIPGEQTALHIPESIEVGERGAIRSQVKSTVARSLIASLSNECKSFCILSGYERLPDSFDTDIDFMVGQDDFERIPHIIEQVARATNTRLFHTVAHELSARSFWLGYQARDQLIIVQPDSTADYRHFELLWLRSEELLAARRWHPHGFWIPSARHEFAYYLIKRLNKRSLDEDHEAKLHRLYLEDPEGCDQMLARFWKGRNRQVLAEMARNNHWKEMRFRLECFRAELRQNSAESFMEKVLSSLRHVPHHLRRIVNPTGAWIAIMGPDGAGKSAVIQAIRQQFSSVYSEVKCFHLRPKSLLRRKETNQPVTDPHGRPARGHILSIAKVFFFIADYWFGYLGTFAPAMMRSQLIVFDRYMYDLLVDSKRVRYGGPAWLLRFAARVIPHPDLVILLDASPEVLWSRKQEVPFEEIERQREEYLQVAGRLSFARIVNAAQPLPDVIHDVNNAIVEHFERRTAERLHLKIPPEPTPIEAPGRQC
jgi:thymidylate kinase